ncbi:AraC family transcriptional regulator [Miltoncostaea oceani]|uniref:AraC family transcriptional regulator n=1 Tax=Miltoncostaea oceani TaxID=2843216 RepID=UPI001C3E5DD0|nr:AraC family transcriptional regulator [Miltoncostaea oceani]
MDVLADLLMRAHARGAVVAHTSAAAPWGLEVDVPSPLIVHAVLEGEVWLTRDGAPPVRGLPGDLLLLTARGPHRLSSDGAAAEAVPVAEATARWGEGRRVTIPGDGPAARLICGAYTFEGALCDQLLAVLPAVVHLPAGSLADADGLRAALRLLALELRNGDPGQQTVLDRMLDVVLVLGLRAWFARPGAEAPAWYRALADPEVGRALRLMHEHPERAWSVAGLAAEVGLSRAAFARRFTTLVGVPPLGYLTGWRMELAADLLATSRLPLSGVAARVGYRSEFALSAAFRRTYGEPPGAHRRRAWSAAPG